jgi:hypothetical protein
MPKARKTPTAKARSGPLAANASRRSSRRVKGESPVDEDVHVKEEGFVHEEEPSFEGELVKKEEFVKEERSEEDEELKYAEETVKEEREVKEEWRAEDGELGGGEETVKEGDIKPFIQNLPDNYLFQVRLRGTSDPIISRLLSVPSHYTFELFHEVLQIALGWANYHMYMFIISKIPQNGEVCCDRYPTASL